MSKELLTLGEIEIKKKNFTAIRLLFFQRMYFIGQNNVGQK